MARGEAVVARPIRPLAIREAFEPAGQTAVELDGQELEHRIPFNRHPTTANVPNQSDIQSVRCGMVIKGVHIDEETGTMIERGTFIIENDGEPILDTQVL